MADRPWEKEGWVTLADEEHELHGVTPEMIDWWWDNMEKGYPLWHPVDHHAFKWAEGKAPGEVGHIGAVQIADQDGGGTGIYLDVSAFPFPIDYEHCMALEGFKKDKENQDYCVHMYSAADYGTKHRFVVILHGPKGEEIKELRKAGKGPPLTPGARTHAREEAERWSEFLPELYKLWSVVKDSRINPHPNLKIKKMGNGRYTYITSQNKPAARQA